MTVEVRMTAIPFFYDARIIQGWNTPDKLPVKYDILAALDLI
jgi:hypothetical protein